MNQKIEMSKYNDQSFTKIDEENFSFYVYSPSFESEQNPLPQEMTKLRSVLNDRIAKFIEDNNVEPDYIICNIKTAKLLLDITDKYPDIPIDYRGIKVIFAESCDIDLPYGHFKIK